MTRIPGFLFVITAPSGAGKTTLISRLRQEFPQIRFSVSTTTRPPRAGEVHGRDYFFVDHGRFSDMVTRDAFIEWAHIHGNDYGTSREYVDSALDGGAEVLFDIDVQGFRALRAQLGPRANYVFIAPPSLETLGRRLAGRGTENPESLALRLKNARTEMEAAGEFDFIVVNDDLDTAYTELRAAYLACHLRPQYRTGLLPAPGQDSHEG
ncbi:MAG: guanylate kinase [Deltaproteobacteria bacterium HGW-Deltaproteobacteria-22]|jgi:guanylate kinase|nr:MAG: guanylate kinase [Deltaproteobacteria bacterium HGW-Deltaproteobacteria-22]